jgi:hypothetical protein
MYVLRRNNIHMYAPKRIYQEYALFIIAPKGIISTRSFREKQKK